MSKIISFSYFFLHIKLHFPFFLLFLSFSSIGWRLNVRLVSSFKSSSKSSLTLVPSLADVSTYLHFHICCSASPVFALTSLLVSSSLLLPTNIRGNPSKVPFTSLMSSKMGLSSSRLCLEQMEKNQDECVTFGYG